MRQNLLFWKFGKIFSAILIFLFFTNCGNDDDVDLTPPVILNSSGEFIIEQSSFDLSQAFFFQADEVEPNLYELPIVLVDDRADFDVITGFSGTTNAIVLFLYKTDNSPIITGTYSVNVNSNPAAGQAQGYYAIDLNFDNDISLEEEDIASGTLTITQNADTSYDLALSSGILDITGQSINVDFQGLIARVGFGI